MFRCHRPAIPTNRPSIVITKTLYRARTRWREVIGVAGHVRLSGLDGKIEPAIYVPLAQNSWPNALRSSFIVIRSSADPITITGAIRRELRSLDPALPITQVRTMTDII